MVRIKLEFLDVGSFVEGEFMLHMNLWDKQKTEKWNLITVYGAAQEGRKDLFLTELASFCSRCNELFLIGCEFNIIRFSNEKNKNNGVHKHTGVFNSIISNFEWLRFLYLEIDLLGPITNLTQP